MDYLGAACEESVSGLAQQSRKDAKNGKEEKTSSR
jgi:hypothetical protein